MFVHGGSYMCGKVDQVPGLFHVATEFVHIQFVPLVPLRSFFFLDGNKAGIPIKLSGKSVLFGYLRAALIFGAIGLGVLAILYASEWLGGRRNNATAFWTSLVAAAGSLAVFGGSYTLSQAGPLRAWRVATSAGLPVGILAEYYARRLTPEQLDELAGKGRQLDELSSPANSE